MNGESMNVNDEVLRGFPIPRLRPFFEAARGNETVALELYHPTSLDQGVRLLPVAGGDGARFPRIHPSRQPRMLAARSGHYRDEALEASVYRWAFGGSR